MNKLTTVMYHYVREIKRSQYPNIKGLEVEAFRRQLDYLKKHYNMVTAEEVIASVKGEFILPSNACWLTFDDGYKDNYSYVLEELVDRKLQGSFFLVSGACEGDLVLDVNKIHFILDSISDIQILIAELKEQVFKKGYSDDDWQALYKKNAIANRFDDRDTIFFKRMLQRELPDKIKAEITDAIFKKYVSEDQNSFAKKLYLNDKEIQEMAKEGMFFGNHTHSHPWLNSLDYDEQLREISKSNEYLESINVLQDDWIMCYPYGGYNKDTLAILSKLNCSAAVTVNPTDEILPIQNYYEIPRFDTNDFPR